MKNLFSPFKGLSQKERATSIVALLFILFLFWQLSGNKYIPPPTEVIVSIPKLLKNGIVSNFLKSIFFCFKTIGYSVVISLVFCYLSVIPFFTSFCEFLRKFRFLPSTGMSFFFMKVTPGIDSMMTAMMVFGITTWLVDSMIGIALSIKQDDIMYARSLRLNRWQTMRELLIYGKAAQVFDSIISNFAMAWMLLAAVENIAKASGGIGVILSEGNKYYHFDEVYAIQIIILLTGILIDFSLRKVRDFLFPYYNLKN
jgi:NitT/TauT family transport system permease protein